MLFGESIRLRAIEREDIPAFVRWFNDPEVRRYLLMYKPLSKAREERWFEAHLDKQDEFIFAIEARTEEGWVHIGNIGLHRVDWKNRNATLGIVLGEKAYWGRGYGTDAVRTALRFAFQELNLHRVELEVVAENLRAIRCYEKAGFIREGTRREALFGDGRYHDAYMMAVLAGEAAG